MRSLRLGGRRILQQVLLHVEGQFFWLAGEDFGDLEQVEEEDELEVFAGLLLALLGGRFGAGGGLAGVVERHPVGFQIRRQGDCGRG